MDNQDETLHGLEDEYMDDLIRLAVKRERMQEAEEILRLSREPVSPEEESRLDRIWSQALARMDEIESRKKKAGRVRTIRSAIINFSRIAACLAVLIVVGAGFAVATNSTFRSAVYNLFVNEDAENKTISINFGKDAENGFDVPAGWLGLYFPTAIPEGFEQTLINEDANLPFIEYEASDGRWFQFCDTDEISLAASIPEGAVKMDINGHEVWTVETVDPVSMYVYWATDDRFISLETQDMLWDEVIRLAESVRRIIPEQK